MTTIGATLRLSALSTSLAVQQQARSRAGAATSRHRSRTAARSASEKDSPRVVVPDKMKRSTQVEADRPTFCARSIGSHSTLE